MKIDWNDETDKPSNLNNAHNGFTVDVLVYAYEIDEHTIGWYDWNNHKWHFLCNEQHIDKFKWRYFINEIDKIKCKSKK